MKPTTVTVGYRGTPDSWTYEPDQVDMTQPGWIIFQRQEGASWTFVSINWLDGWLQVLSPDKTSVVVYDRDLIPGSHQYTVSVSATSGVETSVKGVAADDAPIIKNDGSGQPQGEPIRPSTASSFS